MIYVHEFPTPLGPVVAAVDRAGALLRLAFTEGAYGRDPFAALGPAAYDAGACADVAEQLTAYFAGRLHTFDLPLAPAPTPFQRRFREALCRVPYGETLSYGDLAARLGSPAASRAVGRANATNPLPVVVPCHRVIGADGSLTGYAGGVRFKQALIALERAAASGHAHAGSLAA